MFLALDGAFGGHDGEVNGEADSAGVVIGVDGIEGGFYFGAGGGGHGATADEEVEVVDEGFVILSVGEKVAVVGGELVGVASFEAVIDDVPKGVGDGDGGVGVGDLEDGSVEVGGIERAGRGVVGAVEVEDGGGGVGGLEGLFKEGIVPPEGFARAVDFSEAGEVHGADDGLAEEAEVFACGDAGVAGVWVGEDSSDDGFEIAADAAAVIDKDI